MTYKSRKNFAISTLASGMDDSQLTATVKAGEGALFPTSNFWFVVDTEIMLCSSRTVDVLTITRGDQSTTPAAHDSGARCYNAITTEDVDDLETDIAPITLEYILYRIALSEAYIGNIDCQLQVSVNSDFSDPVVNVDTATSQTSWLAYCAYSQSNEAWSASGMPSTDVRSIIYIGANLTIGTVYYYRWRSYKHGEVATATDYKGGVLCL